MSSSEKPSTSQRSDWSSDDSSLNSTLKRSNRKYTIDAQDSDANESLSKIRSIDVSQPNLQGDVASFDQRSNQKRTADNELGQYAKRLCKLPLTDVPQPDLHRDAIEEDTYTASSLKRSLHGTVYQLKYLMFIIHRARKLNHSFRLATEMDIAEKFDDVVLRYRDSNGDKVYRFVQVKHKQDGTKAITATNLLDMEDGDFSLLKYFDSWRKIKRQPYFRKGKLKDFILCTNIGLGINSLKAEKISVSEVKEPDDFLTGMINTPQPLRYKLLLEKTSSLWDTLRSASNVHGLARELAKRVCGSKNIRLDTHLIKSYHVALAEEIIDVHEKKFFVNFIQNNELSETAAKFREIFFQNTKRLLPKMDQSAKCIWQYLGKRTLKLSSTFGKTTQSATKPEQSQYTELIEDKVNDDEILNFLDEFILAVNQPNELELGKIIERDIGPEFNQLDAGIVRDSFQIKILDWFQKKEGKFLDRRDADKFFDKMKGHLSSIKIMAVSLDHTEKLKELGVRFNNEITELHNYIYCPNAGSKQLLEIISSEQTLLTALRVLQTLTNKQKRERNEIFTIVRLETLSRPQIMDLLLRTFEWSADHNLLVVDCESISCAKEDLQTLWTQISDIMERSVQKKMIVITQEGKDFGTECSLSRQTYRVKNTDHSFSNLTNDSQKKLLGKQVIKFQGRNNETSFGKLLGIDDCDILREDELRDLSHIIDSDILVKLIYGNKIEIGDRIKGLEEIERYYIHRRIRRHVVIKKDILNDNKISDLFAISGKNRVLTAKSLPMEQTSSISQNFINDSVVQGGMNRDVPSESVQAGKTSPLQGHRKENFTILDENQEEEQFQALCAEDKDKDCAKCNVHWLQWEQDIYYKEKYVWKKSQGNITSLVRYRQTTDSESHDDDGRTSATHLSEVDLAAHDEPVIISDAAGMGKSIMLSYLASKMGETEPDMLVLKIDLNHHATALEKVKENCSYDLGSIDGAAQFLVKELLRDETDLAQKVFKRLIIKRKHKVGLIFDGFDEISPDYENTVIALLETLVKYGIKKLVVATRLHTRDILETKLNAFSYEMKLFSTRDQEKFLIDFWRAEFENSDKDLKQRTEGRIIKYTTAVMKELADSINDTDNKFTGNPLQAYLVAEVFGNQQEKARKTFDSCKDFIDSEVDEPKFSERINLIYLYEHFVEKKFQVYFKTTGAESAAISTKKIVKEYFEKFVDKYKRLALIALFGKDKIKGLLFLQQNSSHGSLEITDADIVERDGIVTRFIDGQPQFGHRTYAEYFAAKCFTEMLKKMSPQNESLVRFFAEDILLGDNYETLRAFMDWLLSNEHNDVLEGEFWKLQLKTLRSQRGETILHVAAAEGNGHIIRLFLNCLGANTEDRRVLIHVKNHLGVTAVHLAVEYGHLEKLRLLIEVINFDINSQGNDGRTPLHYAARKGKLDVVQYLLGKGADINSQDKYRSTPLHYAARKGKLDVVQYLLGKGADINSQDKYRSTPLHFAAREGKLDVVQYLLGKGADINSQNTYDFTPLHFAAREGTLDVVQHLLGKGADINSQNTYDFTPLHFAAREGKLDVVQYLLGKGADINSQNTYDFTPLHFAAREGTLDVVQYLLGKGADINSQDKLGSTPLRVAVQKEKLDVVEYLLGKGADINSQDKYRFTPLHHAAREGKLDVVQYLLGKAADINSQNTYDFTPLHSAAKKGTLDVVQYLLGKGADINSQDKLGSTPLHIAAREGKLDVVQYLLGKGADINSQDKFGSTPLHFAASKGKLDVVQYLLGKGADINSQDKYGVTPLGVAVQKEKLDVVEYLLGKGADINSQDKYRATPLHYAAIEGKLDVVQYLLGKGADINSQDKYRFTPLHYAAREGKLDVVQCFFGKGADINSRNKYGDTPLQVAAEEEKLDVVEYLFGKGVNIDSQDKSGDTPLRVAVENEKLDVVEYLFDKGADTNSQDEHGYTVLHAAASLGELYVVENLVGKGVDINSQDKYGNTPLRCAALDGKLDVVDYLVGKGADINSRCKYGATLLHGAAHRGKLDVVEYLLGKGADINSQNKYGSTPLHSVAREGKLDVVQYLVGKGADINSPDKYGNTPLQVAAEEEKLDVVEYLVGKGANINSQDKSGSTPLHDAAREGKLDVVQYLVGKGADINSQDKYGNTPLQVAAVEEKLDVVEHLLGKAAI